MKSIATLTLCFVLSTPLSAQLIGKLFPTIETETVDDQTVTLPQDTKDHITLVAMAYSLKAEKDFRSWLSPLFTTFVQPQKRSVDTTIKVYVVPMFTGIKAAAEGIVKHEAARNLDPRYIPHILFYKGDLEPYKRMLNFEEKDAPYFFLLDGKGEIVQATSGAYSNRKMKQMKKTIRGL